MLASYTELHCLSNFSFLRGASHPGELVERALALGYLGLAITDECSFAGSVRAHLELVETQESDELARSFRLIHGTEIQLIEGSAPGPKLLLLAENRAGYGNLSQLVTLARRQAAKGSYRLSRADLETHADWLNDVLIILLPQRCWREPLDVDRISSEARWLAEFKPGSSWMACELTRGGDDAHHLATLQSIAERHRLSLVAAGDVHMHARGRKRLQDALTAVRLKTPLAQCGRSLAPNAERYLRPLYRLARI
ncbi:MAG: PHP domain-containing protein, partial [Burkholderiaceae bacterium]